MVRSLFAKISNLVICKVTKSATHTGLVFNLYTALSMLLGSGLQLSHILERKPTFCQVFKVLRPPTQVLQSGGSGFYQGSDPVFLISDYTEAVSTFFCRFFKVHQLPAHAKEV